jgi:hypothetical protein
MANTKFTVPEGTNGTMNSKPAPGLTKEDIVKVPTTTGVLEDGKNALKLTAIKNKGNKSGAAFSA